MTTEQEAERAAFKAAIDEQHLLLTEAFERGDAQLVANRVFGRGAWLIGDGESAAIDGPAIGEVFAGFVGKYHWRSESVRYDVSGRIGYDFANAVMRSMQGDEILLFKLLFVWEKVDKEWVAAGQMYVTGAYPG